MNPEMYYFGKTKEDRLREFQEILCLTEKRIPASEIKNEWRFFLQEVIEPMGWKAVWYVSRQECEELAIHFPTVLFVLVEDVNFESFSARVEVIAVKDEAVIAKKHMASLRQLYPTISQDETIAMNVERTADYLEQFRFFFDYVWMPWDEDSDQQDWPSVHLKSRLDLYYDLMSDGERSTAVYVKTLLQEGKDVQQKIMSLEKVIDEERQEEEEVDVANQSRIQALIELHVRQEQIKGEVERLESPMLRTLILKKKQKEMRADEVLCVCEVAIADEIIKLLTAIKLQIEPSVPIKVLPSLQEAVDNSTCGQQIFVSSGIHCIKMSSNVEAGHIRGLDGHEVTTLTSSCSGSCLLQIWCREVTLEGLTLDASAVQMALAVRSRGVLNLHSCRVVSLDRSSCSEGIVVLEGGQLQAIQCKFISFGTAISVEAGAAVVLKSCSISDSHVGILLCETASVLLEKTSITGCKECGIKIQTNKLCDVTSKYGSLSLLESFSEVKLRECFLSDNDKGDVQLVQQSSCLLNESADSGCSFTEP